MTVLRHGEFKRRILKTKKQGQMPPNLLKNQPRTRGYMEARTATRAYNGSNSINLILSPATLESAWESCIKLIYFAFALVKL